MKLNISWSRDFSRIAGRNKEFGDGFPPKDGQVIHVGLNRCGGKTDAQYSQWAPSQTERPQFHSPRDFGKMVLSSKVLS